MLSIQEHNSALADRSQSIHSHSGMLAMSLQDRLDALKADFEGGRLAYKPSPDVLDTMHRATAELIASGQALNAKKAGDKAPEFTLKDADGRAVSSAQLLAQGPLVVAFYRGAWCPYCNLEQIGRAS